MQNPFVYNSEMRRELRPMFRLAVPVVLAEVGWMTMGLVDTVMLGHLDAQALGAASIGSSLFIAIAISGIGMLLGLDFLVSSAYGAGDLEKCYRALVHGVYLSIGMTLPLMAAAYAALALLPRTGIQPEVLPLAQDYLEVLTWAMIFVFLNTTLRRYLQSRNVVLPLTLALVFANVLNAAANWVLIFGEFGFPALGATGAAVATLLCIIFIFVYLFLTVLKLVRDEPARPGMEVFAFDRALAMQLIRLGTPAAVQLTLEVGVFTIATVLAGMLSATVLAAHHIVLKLATFTFMVPLGISAAGAVRVGQAMGRQNLQQAAISGWVALLLGATFMLLAALGFVAAPRTLLGVFTGDAAVITSGIALLYIAAFFQLFDGVQIVATGILRGTGETRTSMLLNFFGHWFLGLPVGYILCFQQGWGVRGLWVGLCTGLIFVAVGLLTFWRRRIHLLQKHASLAGTVVISAPEAVAVPGTAAGPADVSKRR